VGGAAGTMLRQIIDKAGRIKAEGDVRRSRKKGRSRPEGKKA
jgi:hypothetical protein